MATEKDKQIEELQAIVLQQKEEIAKTEKLSWITNCSFSYDKNSANRLNLQVINDIEELISILSFLISKEKDHKAATDILELEHPFKWMGYSLKDWQTDIKSRVHKIKISDKKKKLEVLQTKLNNLVSEERREEIELDNIKKELGL